MPATCNLYLLELEDMLIEVSLQMFICIIYTELLEWVPFSTNIFESKDIQDAWNEYPLFISNKTD